MTDLKIVTYRNCKDNLPRPETMPWEDLQKRLTEHTARTSKDGPAWSPVTYPEGATRANENVVSVSCFVADVDDFTKPADLWDAWKTPAGEPLAWCIHSSHGSTRERPKWRAIFPLEAPVAAADWPAVHRKLTLALVGDHADSATKDASRLYFLPSAPPRMMEQAFAETCEGAFLDPDAFPDVPIEDEADAQMRRVLRSGPPVVIGPGRNGGRPGDDYNERGNVVDLLQSEGWAVVSDRGGRVVLRRPGKSSDYSATFGFGSSRMFYCFTSSAPPFEARKGYSPFNVYTLLRHGGDAKAAAKALAKEGYGDQVSAGTRRAISDAEAPPASRKDAETQQESSGIPASTPQTLPLTEIGLGERLVRRHGQDLRYSYEMGRWFVWDGRRWQQDNTGDVDRRAKETARSIFAEAASEPDPRAAGAIGKFAIDAQKLARRQGMITDARSEKGIPVKVSDLDRRPWLLTCQNGTLDLRTGCLIPADRAHLITKITSVRYHPDAPCPTWQTFLERVLPDPDVRAFVQRAAGYALTGAVTEQCLFFLHGGGRNGKTTMLGTLLAMLGEYGLQSAPDLLVAKDNASGGPNNEIAELQGARLVATIEVEDGKRMAEGLVKQITGGDRIKARFMRQDFFEFEASHKIFLAANHKPTIRGNDTAIWRRIKMIPFTVEIPEDEVDPLLGEKLKEELPGILAWAVRGCLEWQRKGLAEPELVKAATQEYRAEQDVLADYINDRCILHPTKEIEGPKLYADYSRWCEENSDRPLGKKNFNARVAEIPRVKAGTNIGPRYTRGWIGIALRSSQPDPQNEELYKPGKSVTNSTINSQIDSYVSANRENMTGLPEMTFQAINEEFI